MPRETPNTARLHACRQSARVLWPATCVALLTVLGVLFPASVLVAPARSSTGPESTAATSAKPSRGPTTELPVEEESAEGTAGRVRGSLPHLAAEDSAERAAGSSSWAVLPRGPFADFPEHGSRPTPPADCGDVAGSARCHDGRAPPPSTGT